MLPRIQQKINSHLENKEKFVNSSLFIASRFLRTITKEKNIATMLIISGMSIIISTFALALIMAIMNGFQQATSTIIQGIHSDITIEAPVRTDGSRGFLNFEKIDALLKEEFPFTIASATPIAHYHVIIQQHKKTNSLKNTTPIETYQDISHVVLIEGIAPERDAQTRSLMSTISKNLSTKIADFPENSLSIGKALAHDLHITQEDIKNNNADVDLLFAQTTNSNDATLHFEKITVSVSGIFTTGIDDFDQTVIFCSLETFDALFPDNGIDQIGLKLCPNVDRSQALAQLKKRFNLEIMSWQELYPALLDAQKLEKSAMILILLLVACIASVTGISLLLMYLFHQQTTLAILSAMGMPMQQLRTIFTIISLVITLTATIAGILLASLVSWLIETYHLIPLPDVYYVTYVPAHMDVQIIFLVMGIMNIVSLITSWLTTGRIKRMNLAHLLKQSGN